MCWVFYKVLYNKTDFILLYILKIQLSISRGLARFLFFFHLIHKSIKVSDKLITFLVIDFLELMFLHLYV